MRRNDLLTAMVAAEPPSFLFFWGHQPRKDGEVSSSCMSQWYELPFEVDGQVYATAEHFMMAEKARLFGDEAVRERILTTKQPGIAKRLGRSVSNFDEERWKDCREDVVFRGNVAKFSQSEPLREFLLGTGDTVLVEASPVDAVWGIAMAGNDARALDPGKWQGLNLLGFVLMDVREALRRA